MTNEGWCFGSGLRVIAEPDPTRPEVAVRAVVEGGSAGEPAGAHGVAHLTEHLWFQARPIAGGTVASRLTARGATFNAYTSHDHTVFETAGPAGALRLMLELEAARMSDPLRGVDDSSFAVERSIVQQELRQRYADTSSVALPAVYSTLFPPGHPYHRLPIGTEASLADLSLEDVRSYASQWYRPAHMTIHVAGDVDPASLPDVLARALPADLLVDPASGQLMGACSPQRTRPVELPSPIEADVTTIAASVSEPVVLVTWSVPPQQAAYLAFDRYLTEVAMAEALDDDDVRCDVDRQRHAAVLSCRFALPEGDQAGPVARKALHGVAMQWRSSDRARQQRLHDAWQASARASVYRGLERRGAPIVAEHFHETGEQDWLPTLLKQLEVDRVDEAVRFGNQWLNAERARVFHLQPTEDDPAALTTLHARRATDAAESLEATAIDQAFLARVIAEPTWGRAAQRRLDNGLTVTVLRHGRYDITQAELSFPLRPAPRTGLDAATWESLPSITGERWLRALEQGGRLGQFRDARSWTYWSDGTEPDTQLALLRDHVGDQRPDPDLYEPKPATDRTGDSVYTQRERAFLGERAPAEGSPGGQGSPWRVKDLRGRAATQINAHGAHLLVVGDVDPQQVLERASSTVGKLRGKALGRSVDGHPSAPPPEPTTVAVDDGLRRSLATIELECRVETPTATEGLLLAELVQGLTEARLREERGVTYGVHVGRRLDPVGTRLSLRTQVPRAALAEALAEIDRVINGLAGEGPSEQALAVARLRAATQIAERLRHSSSLISVLRHELLQGKPLREVGGFAARLTAFNTTQTRAALAPCAGHTFTIVTGDGLGEVLRTE